ncbi:phage holin family protein [Streptomyces sp. 6N223]|uniref:phage holin family protein n=1 Tax=Streptomyces sp. 6N223 TaxID=3457412 RepID=UPI003FD062E5
MTSTEHRVARRPAQRAEPRTEPRTERRAEQRHRDGSVGELVSAVTADAQTLFRQEVELAKVEIRQEAAKAGQAAGMFGAAGFAGYMVAVFGSLAGVFGLANVMNAAWAALIVTGGWAFIGLILFPLARYRMQSVSPRPNQTMQSLQSLKEDTRWAARHRGS